MTLATRIQSLWRAVVGSEDVAAIASLASVDADTGEVQLSGFDIAPNDPIVGYFLSVNDVVEIETLDLDSPAVRALKEAGVRISVPLLSQGELIGLLNLGPRLSEQDYSADDRRLLNNLDSLVKSLCRPN